MKILMATTFLSDLYLSFLCKLGKNFAEFYDPDLIDEEEDIDPEYIQYTCFNISQVSYCFYFLFILKKTSKVFTDGIRSVVML